jgi:Cation transport ATPase
MNPFKKFVVRLTRPRAMSRHFRRLTILESITGTGVSKEVPSTLAQTLSAAAIAETGDLLHELGSHMEGLTANQADRIRERVGLNEIEHEKPPTGWYHLWHSYRNPFNLLLSLLALVSYLTHDMKATIVISSMVLLSTLLRFWQEAKSNKAADKLKAMVSNTATVLRRDLAADAAEEARQYFNIQLHPKPATRVELPIKNWCRAT